jgi:hypothetical protein
VIRNYLKGAVVTLVLAFTGSAPVWALSTAPEKPLTASVSFGAEYASGSYGTGSTIRSLYLPLIATWSPNERFDFGIEIPFLYQSSSNVTTDLYNGASLSSTEANVAAKGGPGGNSGGSGAASSGVTGLGDIILRAGAVALSETATLPQLRPSLVVKCPTADSSAGLGTGEFDFGFGVEASKWFGNWRLIGEGFYTYQGKAAGFGLNDYVSYTAAVGYQLTDTVQPMLLVKGATAPSSFSGDLLEARARIIWNLTGTTALDLYGSRGIADSSPAYGGGLSVIYSF